MIRAPRIPTAIRISRFSSIVGAAVWFLGVPMVGFAGVIPSDSSYFWEGILTALVGTAIFPVTLAYADLRATTTTRVVGIFGAVASVSLTVTGGLLIGGSLGLLGQSAPGWIITGNGIGLIGLYLWILLATVSGRTSVGVDRPVFWLGLLTSATFLLLVAVSAVQFIYFPNAIDTNATLPLVAAAALSLWLCLPAWLLAVAAWAHQNSPVPKGEPIAG
jgi:hypothetical protein